MAQVPFALSVHHIISSVGADVGFASLIGLALLVLLFFSQARETATLRTRADEAGMRIGELEAELADLAERLEEIVVARVAARDTHSNAAPEQIFADIAADEIGAAENGDKLLRRLNHRLAP